MLNFFTRKNRSTLIVALMLMLSVSACSFGDDGDSDGSDDKSAGNKGSKVEKTASDNKKGAGTGVFSRKQIKIVGSTTVYPHAIRVARAFARKTGHKEPEIKGTGSGGGLKLFCAGIGAQHPDIANASRPMKRKEFELCRKNGVGTVTEIRFGLDGLALVESIKEETLNVTRVQLYKALAKWVPVDGKLVKNPYRNWKEIDPSLPDRSILIYGYGDGHGAYHIFTKHILRKACRNDLKYFESRRVRLGSERKFTAFIKAKCSIIRTDGAYLAADQKVKQVLKLVKASPEALAVLGYSNVFDNRDKLQTVNIDGVDPRIYTISDGSYAMSRPLFFYIKNAHRNKVAGLSAYIKEFMSEGAMGSFGYLASGGLGTLPVEQLKNTRHAAAIGRKIRRFDEADLMVSSRPSKSTDVVEDEKNKSMTIVGWGGAVQAGFKGAYTDLFTKETKIPVKEDSWNGEMFKVRFMKETGKVKWDLVQVEEPEVLIGCDEGLFERLDWTRIKGGKKALVDGAARECGVGMYVWSTVIAYDGDKISDGPKNWVEFWDVKKWPGKRGLRATAKISLEIALMADGVKKADIYKILGTSEGIDRAFKKLEELKPHIVWWTAGTEPQKILASGKVVLTTGYNARIFNANLKNKKNFKIVWEGHHYSLDYWTIVKGSKMTDEAYQFLSLFIRPERQAIYHKVISYGWTAKGAGKLIDPEMVQNMPTYKDHFDKGLLTNAGFWLDHGKILEKRFKAWMAQ